MTKEKYPLFSNGTEFMMWQERNCERCIKAVWYNERKNFYPKHRCAIQKHIEMAAVGSGTGNKRDYAATHSRVCPYIKTERTRKQKESKNLNIEPTITGLWK